jgi:ABC transporter substrate binding protein
VAIAETGAPPTFPDIIDRCWVGTIRGELLIVVASDWVVTPSRSNTTLLPCIPPYWIVVKPVDRVRPNSVSRACPIFKTAEDFDAALASMARENVGGVFVMPAPVTTSQRALLAELALKQRLATIFGAKENVVAGGLMSYGVDRNDLHRRAALYIDKILKGAKPADLPVEQPTKFELVVNLKTARALGIEIPPTLLARADEVIE